MERRRVVVTGLGCVTPLGVEVEHVWKRLLAGDSGAQALSGEEYEKLPTRIACTGPAWRVGLHEYDARVLWGIRMPGGFSEYIGLEWMRLGRPLKMLVGSRKGLEDLERTGVLMGSGIGGFNTICETTLMAQEKGNRASVRFLYHPF